MQDIISTPRNQMLSKRQIPRSTHPALSTIMQMPKLLRSRHTPRYLHPETTATPLSQRRPSRSRHPYAPAAMKAVLLFKLHCPPATTYSFAEVPKVVVAHVMCV